MAWAPGERVGDHVLEERIGSGGMGDVFAARHVETGARYALKCLSPALEPQERRRFEREALAQARVDRHPNVVRLHSAGEAEGRPFLVLDLATGGALSDRLRHGPLDPRRAAEWIRDLALGLHHVHSAGILHRDLKPDNILFDERDIPKLVDFGIASVEGASRLTGTGEVLGTPAYMAPEQALGDRSRIDERTDVYGLGAVLYHCLTGRAPFSGITAILLGRVVEEAPVSPSELAPGLDPDLEAICLRALEKDPARRPPDAAALAALLDAWLRGEPLQAEAKRGSGPVVVGALIGLAAALGFLAFLMRDRTPAAPERPEPRETSIASAPSPAPLPRADDLGWYRRSSPQQPRPRNRHGLVYDPTSRTCLLYGGRSAKSGELLGDLWSWDGQVWTELLPRGGAQPARAEHGMAYDPRSEATAIVGGVIGSRPTSDHVEWNGRSWTERSGLPWPLRGVKVAYDPKRSVLWAFGGIRADKRYSDDLLVHRGGRWSPIQRRPGAPWPPPRGRHALAYDPVSARLVLFGGVNREKTLGDLWLFDEDEGWTRFELDPAPCPRRGASFVTIPGERVLLFGGSPAEQGGGLDDVWVLTRKHWTRIDLPRRPEGRREAALAYFPPRGSCLMFGGSPRRWGTSLHPLWEILGIGELAHLINFSIDLPPPPRNDVQELLQAVARIRGRGEWRAALAALTRLRESAPQGSNLRVLSLIHRAQGRIRLLKALLDGGHRAEALRLRRAALEDLTTALKEAPTAIDALWTRGRLCGDRPLSARLKLPGGEEALRRDQQRGVADMEAILTLDPWRAEAHLWLGRALRRRGDEAAALRHFQDGAQTSLPHTRIGQALRKLAKPR